jgi:hypothetical protein
MIFNEKKRLFMKKLWYKRFFMKKTTLTSDSKLQNVYDKFPSVAKIKEGF